MTPTIAIKQSEYRQPLRRALREVVALFVASFRLEGRKNGGFLPFDTYPTTLKRRAKPSP